MELTLEGLQALGSIHAGLKVIEYKNGLPISEAQNLSDEEQAKFKGVIVLDNPIWIATVSAMPAESANMVYSCDGEFVGMWNSTKRFFYTLKLTGDKLATVKTFNLKEENKMAEIDLSGINLDEAVKGATEATMDRVNSFDNAGAATGKGKRITDEDAAAVVKRIDSAFGGDVLAPLEATRNNRLHGRFIAFVTKNNSTIKASIKKQPVLDANGKKQLLPNAPEEAREKFNQGKNVPASCLIQESDVAFTHSKPSPIIAMIVATPAGTDLPLTSIGKSSAENYDVSKQDKVVRIMSKETGFTYLSYNYGDSIQESEAVLGNKAEELHIVRKLKKDKSGEEVVSTSMKPAKRKALIIDGNYIPRQVYKTLSVQDLDEEGRKILNLNLESAYFKAEKKEGTVFSKHLTDTVTPQADGSVTSQYFNGNEPINVSAYDGSGVIANVNIPTRVRKPKKNDAGFTYSYEFYGLDDMEHGPLADPMFKAILESCNLTADKFCESVQEITHSSSSSSKKKGNVITHEQWLRGIMGKDSSVTSKSIADLQDELDRLVM